MKNVKLILFNTIWLCGIITNLYNNKLQHQFEQTKLHSIIKLKPGYVINLTTRQLIKIQKPPSKPKGIWIPRPQDD